MPRKLRNFIVHRPTFRSKRNGSLIKNVISFKPRHYYKTFQPIIFACLDFESSNKRIDPGEVNKGVPNNCLFQQKPIGYSLAFVSPYNLELPPTLAQTQVKFFNEEQADLDHFYVQILKTLRQSLVDVYNFIRETLTNDKGPPDLSSINEEDRRAFTRSTHCSFCGIRYGRPYRRNDSHSKPGILTKKPLIARKVRHHNHFLRVPNLAKRGYTGNDSNQTQTHDVITLCQFCNINCYNDGFLAKSQLYVALHNGRAYDFVFLHDIISRVGHKKFTQEDKDGNLVTLPIIHGEPQVLYKDKNTLLSLTIRFSCNSLKNCPYHSNRQSYKTFEDKKNKRSCAYQRRLTFFDSALHITASLDEIIQDVKNIHKDQDMKEVFPKSYAFVTKQLNYSDEVFEAVITKKIPQVFSDSLRFAFFLRFLCVFFLCVFCAFLCVFFVRFFVRFLRIFFFFVHFVTFLTGFFFLDSLLK